MRLKNATEIRIDTLNTLPTWRKRLACAISCL